MGSSFHSAHICTTDATPAHAALAAACRSRNLRAWVSPVLGRWLSFFPADPGNSGPLCLEVSDRLAAAVLVTTLHDDRVFSYNLFHHGEMVDEFVSHPDQFDATTEAEHVRMAGDAMKLRELLDWPEGMFKLVQLLQSAPTMEPSVLMRCFFQFLGVVNGLSSYAYLAAGGQQTVALWEKFQHLPDLAAERRMQFTGRRRLRDNKQRLIASGHLLFDSDLARAGAAFRWFSVHSVDPGSGGFICSGYNNSPALQLWRPPQLPQDLPGPTGAFVRYGDWHPLAAGQALATHIVGGTVIVDRHSGRALPQYPTVDAHLVAADETTGRGYFLRRNTLEARPLTGGEVTFAVPARPGVRRFFVHPHEPHLIWFTQRALGILDKHTGRQITELEGCNPLIQPKKSAQWRSRGIDPGSMPEITREDFLALELSPDGKLLFAGTCEGLRIYRYADLVAARIQTPSPMGGVETSTDLQDHQWVHALAIDPSRSLVLYSTGDDTVHSFDWTTSTRRQLTPAFEKKLISQLWYSPIEDALVCWLRGPLDRPRRRDAFSFATWNLAALMTTPLEI